MFLRRKFDQQPVHDSKGRVILSGSVDPFQIMIL